MLKFDIEEKKLTQIYANLAVHNDTANYYVLYMCYFGISNGVFLIVSIFFIVSNMAYEKNTGCLLIKCLAH